MKSTILTFWIAALAFVSPVHGQQTPENKTQAPQATQNSADTGAATGATPFEADELLARTFMATKRYSEAAQLYEKLAKAHPKDPTYLNLAGIAHMQNGELKVARNWFQRCIKVEPRFADAYNNIGATWYSEKDFKKALQFYRRAVALQPGIASYHTNVGYAYYSLKLLIEAEQSFKRALLMDPFIFQRNDRNGSVLQDRSVSDQGSFAYTMASSYAAIGDVPHCANYLRRALDEGYPEIAKLYKDPNFSGVLSDPGMQEILNLIPPPQNEAAVPALR